MTRVLHDDEKPGSDPIDACRSVATQITANEPNTRTTGRNPGGAHAKFGASTARNGARRRGHDEAGQASCNETNRIHEPQGAETSDCRAYSPTTRGQKAPVS